MNIGDSSGETFDSTLLKTATVRLAVALEQAAEVSIFLDSVDIGDVEFYKMVTKAFDVCSCEECGGVVIDDHRQLRNRLVVTSSRMGYSEVSDWLSSLRSHECRQLWDIAVGFVPTSISFGGLR